MLVVTLNAAAAPPTYYILPMISVYDGDTIRTRWNRLPEEIRDVSIRVRGVDTPEMAAKSYYESNSGRLGRAKCDAEAKKAFEAKAALIELIGDKRHIKISNVGWGSYPKRFVANIKVNGRDVGEYMIEKGYAVYDDGKTSKDNKDWCEE